MNMEGPTTKEHKKEIRLVNLVVITLSDSRTIATDDSGHIIKKMFESDGHKVIDHIIIPDDKKELEKSIKKYLKNKNVEIIVTNGGTGVAKRDITVDVIEKLFDKKITAFSTIFTMLSFDDIGSAALVSRATAGIVGKKVIFCLPGSPKAVELGLKKIILPEVSHLVGHLNK
jgi:molybdopterin adenylyltransferase